MTAHYPRQRLEVHMLDPWFDDGADDALELLEHEADTLGCVPLHPDDNRITTHDPVPLCGDDDRPRIEPEPHVPKPYWNRPRIEREYRPRPRPPPRQPEVSLVWPAWPDKMPPPCRMERLIPSLPPEFRWLIGDGRWLMQEQIVAFWEARQRITNYWPGWPTRHVSL